MTGRVGDIRVSIPAVIFGRWAAHPSIDYSALDALMVDGGYDTAATHHGWVVTYVRSGRSLPVEVADHLDQGEAEAIAAALDAAGGALDGFVWWTEIDIPPAFRSYLDAENIVEAIVARVLDEQAQDDDPGAVLRERVDEVAATDHANAPLAAEVLRLVAGDLDGDGGAP